MMNGTLTVTRGDHVAIHTHTVPRRAGEQPATSSS